jgi:hypothetical protein
VFYLEGAVFCFFSLANARRPKLEPHFSLDALQDGRPGGVLVEGGAAIARSVPLADVFVKTRTGPQFLSYEIE